MGVPLLSSAVELTIQFKEVATISVLLHRHLANERHLQNINFFVSWMSLGRLVRQ